MLDTKISGQKGSAEKTIYKKKTALQAFLQRLGYKLAVQGILQDKIALKPASNRCLGRTSLNDVKFTAWQRS